jgi:2-methylcitrate dehydratase PrpD
MSESLTLKLASYAENVDARRLPPEVLERVKQVIVDEIASAYFCARSLAGGLAARYAHAAGGYPEARIYATGHRVSAANAALANGAAGHGEEVDGAHVSGGHPGASIVHAAVAVAERQRSPGADLISAVVAGYDVGVEMVDACGGLFELKERFKLNSDFLYAFGCAAASAKILGLNESKISHAMALVSFNANALANFYAEDRHISKSLCNGQFASAGVSAALMASVGLEGHKDIIGSQYGALDAWGTSDVRAAFADKLGQSFAIMGANFKFINAGYPIHAAVEATMDIVRHHQLEVDSIEELNVGMPTAAKKVVDSRSMRNICLQDMLAAAVLRGGLHLRHSPFPDVLSDPRFAPIRAKINLYCSEELDQSQPKGRGAIVSITSSDGRHLERRVDHPKGHSKRGGVSWSDLHDKWQEGLPDVDVARMIDVASHLEEAENVEALLNVLQK